MSALNETWDGVPGWHHIHPDHVAGSRFNRKHPAHAKLAQQPSWGHGYIGHLDDMGVITHHLRKGKVTRGKPWKIE
jgi:hypothetical protein